MNIRKGEVTWLMSYFDYSEHFYKNSGPSWTVCPISRDEREKLKYFSNGRTIKETDSDWQLGEQ